jgi:hypothetical protein
MSSMQNVPIIDISRFLDGSDKKDIVAGRCRKALARSSTGTPRQAASSFQLPATLVTIGRD